MMILLLVLGGCVVFGLIVGWQWFFEHNARRAAIMEFAAKKEVEAKKRADAAATAEISEVLPKAKQPEDNLPKVSLGDMAKEGLAGKDGSAVPKEAVTITLPLDPNSPDVQQADDLLQAYWKTKKWQERMPFVYQPERTRVLMEQFYDVQKGSDPVSGALLNRGHYRIDGTEILHFTYSCNRPGDVLELAMRRNADGRFVLDWTSYVGFGEMSWDTFKKERSTTPKLFRAFASGSDYYNYEFTDRQKYLSVNLLSPDGQISLHGYCERDSPLGTALAHTLSRTNTMSGVVIRLAYPEKSESDHCVIIQQFVADRWLMLP